MKIVKTGSSRYTKQFNSADDRAADIILMNRLLSLSPREKFIFFKLIGCSYLTFKRLIDNGRSFRKDTRMRLKMFLGIQDNPRVPLVNKHLESLYGGKIAQENHVSTPKEYLASFGLDEY